MLWALNMKVDSVDSKNVIDEELQELLAEFEEPTLSRCETGPSWSGSSQVDVTLVFAI